MVEENMKQSVKKVFLLFSDSFRLHDRIAAPETDGQQRVCTDASAPASRIQYKTLRSVYLGETARWWIGKDPVSFRGYGETEGLQDCRS